MPTDRDLDELAAERAIRVVLARYCRGIDRLDLASVRECYWDDATDTHGSFAGTVDEFIAWVGRLLPRYDMTFHFMGNTLIEFPPAPAPLDVARSELYAIAFHRNANGDPKANLVTGCRYVDRFERRGSQWRIARRVLTTEWVRVDAPEHQWPTPAGMLSGRRDGHDIVQQEW